MDGRGEAQKRGGGHAFDEMVLVFGRISRFAHREPGLLDHHVPGRLSWQHVEVDVEAWMGAPCWQPGVEFLAVTRTLNRRTLAEPRPGSTSVTRPAISDRAAWA